MTILVGIDEAGYGPILGPLVVSAAVFELPDEMVGQSLWDILRASVAKTRAGSRGRVIVADSKKLHRGLGQYADLQRGVLAFLAAGHACQTPRTLGELLTTLGLKTRHDTDGRWYDDCERAAIGGIEVDDLSLAAGGLRSDLRQRDITFHGLTVRVLHPGPFNALVDKIDNKASVLFAQAAELIDQTQRRFPNSDMQFVIDKHGGRDHYREHLGRLFEGWSVKILKEAEGVSSYALTSGSRTLKFHFLARGDDRQLPVALASMTSKYLRELFMERFNDYFSRSFPAIKPTAGYYEDGMRFLNDLTAAGYDVNGESRRHLVRSR